MIRRKHGYAIEDIDGNVYLDMISAMASVPLGAGREDLLEAAIATLREFGNEDQHYYANELMRPLAERLLALSPSSLTRVDIALTGTEAIETGLRFMRRATGRPIVIGFMGSFHGEAGSAGALGAETSEQARGIRGVTPGYVHVPYPNPYRSPFGPPRAGGTGDATVDYMRDFVLYHAVDPGEVAGVVIEPILGSGGCVAPPASFWPALVELCREFDWLLFADEAKTGFGRSGELFAVQRWGVEPDLMALGKAMGGGVMPIAALLGSERAMDFDDVSTGSTWAWLPGSCAAALATLDAFANEPILENVRAIETAALETLTPLRNRFVCIGDVRATGGFIAVEFVRDRETKDRWPELQEAVALGCARRGMLVDSSTTSLNLQPSLVMPPSVMTQVAEILDASIAEAVGEMS